MKKFSLFPFLLLSLVCNSQLITRGPDVGEIFFITETLTSKGLYYSANSGETSVYVDNASNILAISTDKTKGGIYCIKNLTSLYYSNNYGYTGTWSFRKGNIYPTISSGRTEGEIYQIDRHSLDFGYNFINHSLIGYWGSFMYNDIGNQPGVGYALVASLYIGDTVYLFTTSDNYNHVSITNRFHYYCSDDIQLSRGSNFGELYMHNFTTQDLLLSFDDGVNFTKINQINYSDYYRSGITGGREEGELYLLFNSINMIWQYAHTFILYSTDYGQTFTIIHPLGVGWQPLFANFSARAIKPTPVPAGTKLIPEPQTGPAPLYVRFYNYTIGNIKQYRWDFNNDGIIDSYQANPKWTYNEPGYYSVKLTTLDVNDSVNTFLRENYVHVLANFPGNDTVDQAKSQTFIISNHPNPFKDATFFEVTCDEAIPEGLSIEIYDMQGRLVKTLPVKHQIQWDGTDRNQERLSPGVYVYRVPGHCPASGKVVLLR